MSQPLSIAVSMPIGGWHPLLPAVLASLSKQDVELEVAIMDASADPRVAKAIEMAPFEPAYLRVGPDNGQAAAIAEGWRATSAPLMTWLNADDMLLPGALLDLARVMNAECADVAYGDSIILGSDGGVIGVHGQVSDVTDTIYRSNCISQPSALIRRSRVDQIGGINPDLKYTMDWDLWARVHASGGRFVRLDDTLSAVFWGDGTKTSEVSASRLAELFSLTRRNAGLLNAAKTVVSSALQTKALNSRKTPSAPGLFWSADSNPREIGLPTLRTRIPNPHPYPVHFMHIEWGGQPPGIRFPANAVPFGSGAARIPLETPLLIAEAVNLELTAPEQGWSRLKRIWFTAVQ